MKTENMHSQPTGEGHVSKKATIDKPRPQLDILIFSVSPVDKQGESVITGQIPPMVTTSTDWADSPAMIDSWLPE